MLRRLALLALVCLLFTSTAAFLQVSAAPRIIIVPDNYPTITAAIANAANGDVIYVKDGVYNDSAFIINKSITIQGEDVKNTIINLTPTVTSVYSSYFNRTYFFPADAIKINADNVKISDITVSSTGGITGNGSGIAIISNIITFGTTCSITGSKVTVERNTLNCGDWRQTGSNLTLAENKINANSVGVSINGSYCNLYGNNINGTLVVWGSVNTFTHNSYDLMFIYYGDNNTIQGNSGDISLGNSDQSCSNNVVSGNLMKGPSVWGIWIGQFCRNNVFYDNYIEDEGYASNGWNYNSGVIFCNEYGALGTNNIFYHNAFVNNSVNVRFYNNESTGGNIWDNGVQGNYWSDYNGSGDTPYVINSENRDNHPLTAPFDPPTISIAPPVYDPPIDESQLSQSLTSTPTLTPTTNPPQPTTSNTPIEQPATTSNLSSLLTVLSWSVFGTLAIILAAALIFVTTALLLLFRWHRKTANLKQ